MTASSDSSDTPCLSFDTVVLDRERRTLHVGGEERHLRAKSFDVLVYLARRAGRMVSKKELFDEVWAGSAVTDDSLVQCLIDIRRVLGKDGDRIRTVRGHGYLLDAEVRAVDAAPSAAPATASAAPQAEPRGLLPVSSRVRRVAPAVAVAALLAAAAGMAWQASRGIDSASERRVAPQSSMDPRVEALMEDAERAMLPRSQTGLQKARDLYESAIAFDPRYAPAHASLSNTLSVLHAFGVERPRDLLPLAQRHARRAIALDPTHALGWHALAHSQVHWTREWSAAEANYRRAIALDPTAINPQFLLAHLLMGLKRPEEAVRQSLHALSLDPGALMLNTSSGIVHYFTRRFEEALRHLDRALAIDQTYATAAFWKALTQAALGRPDEAMHQALAARRAMGNAPTWIVGYVHARSGRLAEAREVLQALDAHRQSHYVPTIELAYLHLALGDRERALTLLAESVDEHSRWIELIAVDPILDPLRDEPRFQALVARMGFPEE